jgi:SAM-dependent methyltransferase
VGSSAIRIFDNASPPELPGLSRRVLRHVIVKHDLPVGSSILDVGCGTGQLVHFLHQLGFDVTGIDRNEEVIAASRKLAPSLDLRYGRFDETAISGMRAFDAILLRDFAGYDDDLFSERSLRATANLLSCLRPGRMLVFLARTGAAHLETAAAHSMACYQAHLAAFPGVAQTSVLPDSYAKPGTWKSLLAGQKPIGYLTATMQVPAMPVSRDDWLEFAASAARVQRPACCQAVQSVRPAA